MINTENFSDKFQDIKKVNFHSYQDLRGSFLKIHESKELETVMPKIDEVYLSNSKKNVIRGIHFQKTPHQLSKLVTCISGKIMDLFIDLRKNSKYFGCFEMIELSESDKFSLLIPEGFGHGFSVLSDSATLLYCQTGSYERNYEDGIHPLSLDTDWCVDEAIISERDSKLPIFNNKDERFFL